MTKKTAMQTVIDYLQEMLDDDFDSRTKYIQEFCQQALETEKQQIIEAFSQEQKTVITEPEQYYNETFKQ